MSWQRDKRWSDQYIPAITRAIAPHLVVPAPLELDAKEATDLLVFHARDMRIAARIRKHQYLATYGDEFTIRSRRDSGAKTELRKIVEGWGDWMLYGFAAVDGPDLAAWRLLDLSVLRSWICEHGYRAKDGRLPGSERGNGDGTFFCSFRPDQCPIPGLVIASDGHARAVAA